MATHSDYLPQNPVNPFTKPSQIVRSRTSTGADQGAELATLKIIAAKILTFLRKGESMLCEAPALPVAFRLRDAPHFAMLYG